MCVDEAISGALEAADRPGLSCALDAITTSVADGVIAARLDRLARQLAAQEATLALVWQRGAKVFAAGASERPVNDAVHVANRPRRERSGHATTTALGREQVG